MLKMMVYLPQRDWQKPNNGMFLHKVQSAQFRGVSSEITENIWTGDNRKLILISLLPIYCCHIRYQLQHLFILTQFCFLSLSPSQLAPCLARRLAYMCLEFTDVTAFGPDCFKSMDGTPAQPTSLHKLCLNG